jgi:putative chitinase
MGNGDEKSGDGWKYRGRGFIQITGKNNYKALSEALKVDYLNNPDLLLNEADSMLAALWYWSTIGANKYADNDNLDAISDLINFGRVTAKVGDANGYMDRAAKLRKYKAIFND